MIKLETSRIPRFRSGIRVTGMTQIQSSIQQAREHQEMGEGVQLTVMNKVLKTMSLLEPS